MQPRREFQRKESEEGANSSQHDTGSASSGGSPQEVEVRVGTNVEIESAQVHTCGQRAWGGHLQSVNRSLQNKSIQQGDSKRKSDKGNRTR